MIDHSRKIRFGLNYVPSKQWYYCWNAWSTDDVAHDFDAMARLGIDHIRVMVVWPYFQPNPTVVSSAHLKRLAQLMKLAAERGLDVLLCPLTGWLSGYRLLPAWVEARDIFCSEKIFAATQGYFTALLRAAEETPGFLGFDLGNEINVLAPDLPVEQGDAWATALVAWLRSQMAGRMIVNGVDHVPWFSGRTFSARHLVEAYDAVTLHAWPLFTGCLLRGSLSDEHATHLSAFMAKFAGSFLKDSGQAEKPIWVQEFGCSSRWGSAEEMSSYLEASVSHAIEAGATWFTWWCSHDIDHSYSFDSLEYDLGLLTINNEEKSLARLYRELIKKHANTPPFLNRCELPGWTGFAGPAVTELLPPEEWLKQNLKTTTWNLFEDYLSSRHGQRS